MSRLFTGLVLLLASCDCGSSHVADAGEDVLSLDSGEDVADTGVLPEVIPMTPGCDGVDVPEGRRCLEHGWFNLGRWSTLSHVNENPLELPMQPVFLETFLQDVAEVSVEEYSGIVEAGNAAALPVSCGYEDREHFIMGNPSGWKAEEPDGRAEHPVVCVTRAEAQNYCAAQGGRLPTTAEWMRAGQAAYPSFQRFPWGNTPPELGLSIGDTSEIARTRVTVGASSDDQLRTTPVLGKPMGNSPAAIAHLSGNAGEILSDCTEQILDRYGRTPEPLIRPAVSFRATCEEGVVVGGGNWRSVGNFFVEKISQTLWTMTDDIDDSELQDRGYGFEPLGPDEFWSPQRNYEGGHWGTPRPIEGTPADGAGNLRRSWRIGFRCVYDL